MQSAKMRSLYVGKRRELLINSCLFVYFLSLQTGALFAKGIDINYKVLYNLEYKITVNLFEQI